MSDLDRLQRLFFWVSVTGFVVAGIGIAGEFLGWWNDAGEVLTVLGILIGALVGAATMLISATKKQATLVVSGVGSANIKLDEGNRKLDHLVDQSTDGNRKLDHLVHQSTDGNRNLDRLVHQSTDGNRKLDHLVHQSTDGNRKLDRLVHQSTDGNRKLDHLVDQSAERNRKHDETNALLRDIRDRLPGGAPTGSR